MRVLSTPKGVQYDGGYLQYRGGYHDYCGRYLQYHWGHSVPWRISWCMWEDIMSTVGVNLLLFEYPYGTHDIPHMYHDIPHMYHDIPHGTQITHFENFICEANLILRNMERHQKWLLTIIWSNCPSPHVMWDDLCEVVEVIQCVLKWDDATLREVS